MSTSKPKPPNYVFGRPTKYTPELANLILERFATHPVGIMELCNMYEDMPAPSTIYEWRNTISDFSERFLNARISQSHILFESSLDDVREIKNYYYEDEKLGCMAVDSGIVAAQKAMAHHKMAMASKIHPRIYGAISEMQKDSSSLNDVKERVKDLSPEHEKEF